MPTADELLGMGAERPAEKRATAEDLLAVGTASPRSERTWGQWAAEELPVIAGGGIGGAVGLLGGPLGVAAGGALGAATGYGAGQKLSEALGFTPSPPVTGSYAGDVALAAGGGALSELGGQYVLAPAARAVTRGVTGLLPATPAAKAAAKATARKAGQEVVAEAVEEIPAIVRPKVPSATLYKRVEEYNPLVPIDKTRQVVKDLLGTEAGLEGALQNKAIIATGEALEALAQKHPEGIPFQELWKTAQRVGKRVGATARAGGEEYGAMKTVYRTLQEDIEAAAGSGALPKEAAAALREANAAFRQELTAKRLTTALKTPSGRLAAPESGRIAKALEGASGEHKEAVLKTLEKYGDQFAGLGVAPKQGLGDLTSRILLERGVEAVSGVPGIGLYAPNIIGGILSNPTAHNAVRKFLDGGGRLAEIGLPKLAQLARGDIVELTR